MNDFSWKLLDIYFKENPDYLVAHHLESYNQFFKTGLQQIFHDNNPIRFITRDNDVSKNEKQNECYLYLGGKEGNKIYYGKPIIYDDNNTHYMFPNDARLRNMTYGITIHYDVDVDFIYYNEEEQISYSMTLEKIYLGKFPIMLQSNLCILQSLHREVRFTMGECKNDYGGYFIIDGKEKTIIMQEKFSDNIIYIKKHKDDAYTYSAEIRSVSENTSKPIRVTSVRIVAESGNYLNGQIVVDIPNVKLPIPLFILMRALGVISDKEIIETCLLNLEENHKYIDSFIPSVYNAHYQFTQESSLQYIASFTKRGTLMSVLDIFSDYMLPHIGENNYLDKAYFIGYMVFQMLKVSHGDQLPTDRDNFKYKRVELAGDLLYDLFREYYIIQKRLISKKIDEIYYYHKGEYQDDKFEEKTEKEGGIYKNNFIGLIADNYYEIFKEREVEAGVKKGFKGNWGSVKYTKRLGAVQDVNRLSYYTFISHLRKINLPLDASAKVVGPRLLHNSQWGYIDPIDTPDGGNIGLHKHLSICAKITTGSSSLDMISWIKQNTSIKGILECTKTYIHEEAKLFVNGNWIGIMPNALEFIHQFKLFRRNGLIPYTCSISFDYKAKNILIFTDGGRLIRPLYYIEQDFQSWKQKWISEKADELTWSQIVSGVYDKVSTINTETYHSMEILKKQKQLYVSQSIIEYIDSSEQEGIFISNELEEENQMVNKKKVKKNEREEDSKESIIPKKYTHKEIHHSLLLGVMGNLIIFPEHNPVTRNSFSCGQSKQAVSLYSTNYNARLDKMGVVLHYGETPLIQSRYLNYINKEQNPYGFNTIVAIMSHTSYNVEDAILINEGSIKRGLFRTTYYSSYESREESSSIRGNANSKFVNIEKENVIKIKPDYDYSFLDEFGLIKENTPVTDKTVLIGKVNVDMENKSILIDDSVKPKKGQNGFVDKTFITEGEEGFNIAKVRVRDVRIPAMGDKMASRAGQKGTIGLIIPQQDMPFTKDGLQPDLIINPHAFPSRMTIGHVMEVPWGKVCLLFGAIGDCTAFEIQGSNDLTLGKILSEQGFHSSGNEILYNGTTGKQLDADIFIGPTYYMRLKHMVKDKINYRATGPRTNLTRQTVQGRANDGGLRIGEMERDGVLAHGMSSFLNDSFLKRADEYYISVCNKSGCIAIYNENKNIMLSPFADGPITFYTNVNGTMSIKNISKHGRSFSIFKIPYSFKLLIQELQSMNIQMRLISDDNIDQLLNQSYSTNINKILNLNNKNDLRQDIYDFQKEMKNIIENINLNKKIIPKKIKIIQPKYEEPVEMDVATTKNDDTNASPEYSNTSPVFIPEYDSQENSVISNDFVPFENDNNNENSLNMDTKSNSHSEDVKEIKIDMNDLKEQKDEDDDSKQIQIKDKTDKKMN
jgi:DNA-directed RNA polymerase II subunit RPB2